MTTQSTAALSAITQALQDADALATTATDQLAQSRADNSALTASVASLTTERDGLRMQLATAPVNPQALADLQTELDSAAAQTAQLTKANGELVAANLAKIDEIGRLTRKLIAANIPLNP